MGSKLSTPPPQDMEYLQRKTTYTPGEIKYLYNRFCRICGKHTTMKMKHLMYNVSFQENPIMEPLANALFGANFQGLSFVEFAMALHLFKAPEANDTPQLAEQRTKEKMKFIYQIYDLSGTGKLSRHDLYTMLYRMYGDHLDNADLYRVIDILIAEVGTYGADFLSMNDVANSLIPLELDDKLRIRFPHA